MVYILGKLILQLWGTTEDVPPLNLLHYKILNKTFLINLINGCVVSKDKAISEIYRLRPECWVLMQIPGIA